MTENTYPVKLNLDAIGWHFKFASLPVQLWFDSCKFSWS